MRATTNQSTPSRAHQRSTWREAMKPRRTPARAWRPGLIGLLSVSLVVGVLAVAMNASPASASNLSEQYQLPFPCGEEWNAATYPGHGAGDNALDFNLYGVEDSGKDILASADGTVIRNEWLGAFGWIVELDHGSSGGHRFTTFYAHLASQSERAVGTQLEQGDRLGAVGGSGGWTSHLHYEQRMTPVGRASTYSDTQAIQLDGKPVDYHYFVNGDHLPTDRGAFHVSNNCESSGASRSADSVGVVVADPETNRTTIYRLGQEPLEFCWSTAILVWGDWNNSGVEQPGCVVGNPTTNRATWYLYGAETIHDYCWSTTTLIVGDWLGDGVDRPGCITTSTGNRANWHLHSAPTIHNYCWTTTTLIVGDWLGDGVDRPGCITTSTGNRANWHLHSAPTIHNYGWTTAEELIAGRW